MIDDKQVYGVVLDVIGNTESITWSRFYNFLMFNTILILAWSTLFATATSSWTPWVMAMLCLLGGLSGIAWAALGRRGRKNLGYWIEQGKRLESKAAHWTPGLEPKVCTEAINLRDKLPYGWAGSWHLLVWVPLACTALYVFLAMVSFLR